jgi:LGFP repeat
MGNQQGGPAFLQEGTVLQGGPIVVRPVDVGQLEVNPNRERDAANNSIAVAHAGLNGAPGAPRAAEGPDGLVEIDGGFYREYESGRIYTKRQVGTFWVFGAIGDRYTELGGPSSPLGWPTSPEVDFEGGRVTTFQNGAIYWWPDTGAIDLGDVALRYKGIVCFGETDWDQSSDSDEPYAVMGVIPADPARAQALASQVYQDVDAIQSRGDSIDLYLGRPHGAAVTTTIMEQDFGTPEQAREVAAEGVRVGTDVVSGVLEIVPYVGPILGTAAERALKAAETDIADAVVRLFGLRDDAIGTDTMVLSPKRMVTLTREPELQFMGIGYRVETGLLNRHGASYKAYFDVLPV